jgi:Na+-driven multidrug efflux pump
LTTLYCLVVTVPTALAFVAIPERLVSLFTTDPGVIADGSLYLRIVAFAQIGQTFELVLEGALVGAGYTFWPMLVGTICTALRIPLAAWWSGTFGLFGIWLALSLTAIARGVANTAFWLSGVWRRSQV